jgi:leucyl aminopeptidase
LINILSCHHKIINDLVLFRQQHVIVAELNLSYYLSMKFLDSITLTSQTSSESLPSYLFCVIPTSLIKVLSNPKSRSQSSILLLLDNIFNGDAKKVLLRFGKNIHSDGSSAELSGVQAKATVLDTGHFRLGLVWWDDSTSNTDISSLLDKKNLISRMVRMWGGECARIAQIYQEGECAVYLPEVFQHEPHFVESFCEGVVRRRYKFTQYRSLKKDEQITATTKKNAITSSKQPLRPQQESIKTLRFIDLKHSLNSVGSKIANYDRAYSIARTLVNLAPCDSTPTAIVNQCREVARKRNLRLVVRDEKRLKTIGAGSFLAVSRGSDEPGFIVSLSYSPQTYRSQKPRGPKIALVGKGITFDSGGYSLKPADSMKDMKMDMAGAAAVIGAIDLVSALKLPIEVVAYVATCENLVSGCATRPGDVVKSLSGKTIEILNTDAEGRLILADTVTLAAREGAEIIVDIATLTGACMVALGTPYAGLFTADEELATLLQRSGEEAGELLWRLPLGAEYRAMMKSSIADICNMANTRYGGASSAASFIQSFIPAGVRWAHLDIAGSAFIEKDTPLGESGATGFGVGVLTRFVSLMAELHNEPKKVRSKVRTN